MTRRLLVLLALVAGALVVAAGAAALNIADTVPPRGKVGQSYAWTLTTEPGSGSVPLKWRVHSGVFPPGLTLAYDVGGGDFGRTARVTGTPTVAGVYRFFIQLEDSVCCPLLTEEEFVITIDPADQPPPPPPPTSGSAFPITLVAQDATTLTLQWARQPADGYVFYFGGLERSRTRDPKRVTVRVSKGWPEYLVCPGDLVVGARPCGRYVPVGAA